MDANTNNTPSSKYWMSLDQWRQDPEFQELVEKEFQSSPLQSEDGQDGNARRDFLKLMGASLALTTFGCVRRPAQKIIPYVKKPADIVHGIANYYASSMVDGLETLGTLVATRDGRPIKIDGNPDHAGNQGGMSARAHAAILKLYDPDRFNGPKRNLQNAKRTNRETIGVKWEALDAAVVEQLKKGGVAVLTGTNFSPTGRELMDDFVSSFGAKLYRHDDVSYEILLEGAKASFGQAAFPLYDFNKAKFIVAVNNDFLGTWLTPTVQQRQFAAGRKADSNMNKLVVFESTMSLTGSNADERYRIRPSQSLDVIMGLLHEIIVVRKQSRYAGDAGVANVISAFAKSSGELGVNLAPVVDELLKSRGQSLVVAGGLTAETENALALYVATNFLNAVLENEGKTVGASPASVARVSGAGVGDLIAALHKKEIRTLIVHGCNPFYSLPASTGLREAAANLEMLVYTGDRNDETGCMADYVATDHHHLESWGDYASLGGVLSIQQPTITPLYDSRAFQDSLLTWMQSAAKGSAKARGAKSWYEYLRSSWQAQYLKGGKFEEQWVELLQLGVLNKEARSPLGRSFITAAFTQIKPSPRKTGLELALYQKCAIGDGSLANVPWLQELPDSISKVTWDNYVCLAPKDAVQSKIKDGQHVSVEVGGVKITLPALIQPGQAEGVVAIAVGYGRKGAGKVADGIGENAFSLAKWSNAGPVTAGLEAKVVSSGGFTELAITQGHHVMEGRQLVVEETLHDHIEAPGGQVHRHNMKPEMWADYEYKGNKWGMVIDLNTCTGCQACVVACQSENNIPTVGKRYVIQGREMHWIRIDRYYVGTPDDPAIVYQPLPCMHCEKAPCETVCPVIATAHSDEGTNDMIYNRCVGTRYCSNNCPYKVRRFNWFDYTEIKAPRQMALNPEVTVRHRGVMEKCTFCIHRIRSHKQTAKIQGRALHTDEVQTACAQSCPTKAITFGDLNDKDAQVVKKFNQPQSYILLEELNTEPRVRYQVKVRNSDKLKGETKAHHGEGHHA
jgi:MoCo/4Fe-4S cofactor protein with predicted Tat translocation signal